MFASSSLCSVFTSGDVSAGSVSTLNSNGGSKSCTVPSSVLKKNQQSLVNIVSYVAVLSFVTVFWEECYVMTLKTAV